MPLYFPNHTAFLHLHIHFATRLFSALRLSVLVFDHILLVCSGYTQPWFTPFVYSMAEQWNLMVVFQILFIMAAVTAVTGARPVFTGDRTDVAKVAAICTSNGLVCAESTLQRTISRASRIQRDYSINTINDFQRDFFLESALVVGGKMTLDANLRDDAPKRAFLTASSANQLPTLTSSNSLALVRHFGVAPNSDLSTATATAAYLCGYGALPGESMTCATSSDAVAKFVSSELGSKVKVLSTTNTPALAPGAAKSKAPVTITSFRKGSVAEGQKIVVCHVMNFPSSLYYCHRVTGTKVITATLQPSASDADIQAVGVCHIDTSLWLSTHPAFNALNIPRGDEACHWLVDSDLVFVPTTTNADAQME